LLRRASRGEQRLFLAEGPQAVREALATPDCVVEVFATEGAPLERELRAPHSGAARPPAWHYVDEAALTTLTQTVHPQGIVAVCRFLDVPLDTVTRSVAPGDTAASTERPALLAVCADVRDPGNAGTVVRCADAAGADAVILAGNSVDPYNGKAVRASAGSLFHVPIALAADPAAVVRRVRSSGVQVLAADGAGELDLDAAEDADLLRRPTAWLFGNEAWGLPDELAALADHRVAIPIHGRAESLNLATAAAVCLYSSARHLRRRPHVRR
jgi:TrmH family RNA methyltransferase